MIEGYLRSDGRKGIRNVVAVAYLAADPDDQVIAGLVGAARQLHQRVHHRVHRAAAGRALTRIVELLRRVRRVVRREVRLAVRLRVPVDAASVNAIKERRGLQMGNADLALGDQRADRDHRAVHQRRRGLVGEFERPHRELCGDCPGRKSLCSWPEAVTLRPYDDSAGITAALRCGSSRGPSHTTMAIVPSSCSGPSAAIVFS